MKRNDAEPIGKLIQKYLRQESLESPLNEQRYLIRGRRCWDLLLCRTQGICIFVIRCCMYT